MPQLPIVTARILIAALEKEGFEIVRQKGSHLRLKHSDGRVVTVPVHPGQDIRRGLLRKILRDADITSHEFLDLLK
jgi:predicted RNA binding protein YcfA (HicA-like mRNA interferase family)